MNTALHRFFFDPCQDRYSMAFFRIGLALILLAQTVALWGDFLTIYGSQGLIRAEVAMAYTSPLQLTSHHLTHLISSLLSCSELDALIVLRYVYVGLIVMLGLGLFSRFSAVMLWILHLSLVKSAFYLSYGMDFMHNFLLFYCLFFPISQRYSLDAMLFRPRERNPRPYLRLLQLHMCIIYLFGGLGKAFGPNWWNGESIWKSVNRPLNTTFSFDWMADYSWIPLALGISVIVLELLYPVGIWLKPVRKYWLWGIISMHLGIALFLDLAFFAATMILMNLTAFYFFWQRDEQAAQIFPKLSQLFQSRYVRHPQSSHRPG